MPMEVSCDDTLMLAAIGKLRVKAWKARQPNFPDMDQWLDDFDSVALHWAIMDAGQPVAAARMTIHDDMAAVPNAEIFSGVFPAGLPGPIASINRLVIHPDFAGLGLSRSLDEARIAAALKLGCANVIAATLAKTQRISGLESLGFRIIGTSLSYASGPLALVDGGGAGGTPTALRMMMESPKTSSSSKNPKSMTDV